MSSVPSDLPGDLSSESSVRSDKVSRFPLTNAAILAAGVGTYHPFTFQDMLENYSLNASSSTALPGCSSLAGDLDPSVENPWMAMKHRAFLSVLNRPSNYVYSLPATMPGSQSRSVRDLKLKGKQLVGDPSPSPLAETHRVEQPLSPKTQAPADPIVHLVSRVGTTYQSPYPPSKSTSAPSSFEDDESTLGPMSPRSTAPPAFKRSRMDSAQPNSTLNGTGYLDLTARQIDTLLHEGREFPTRFIYNAEQLNEIAHCCLIDLIDFFNFYAPGSPQEASARLLIFRLSSRPQEAALLLTDSLLPLRVPRDQRLLLLLTNNNENRLFLFATPSSH
ncbi:hypothetical protein PGTUg99_008808 [Puccinia graminis f. sp. tritici]|uniref:Uncharacterized protein n=1 Tax=Puccinia graminis f. sp. tritici TaxID=56615 RepID=A0A5B0RW84_PUCGR|nr:hypothetical protein PGTUg99_008808 [Puccinia graminis f. sp. tritici]